MQRWPDGNLAVGPLCRMEGVAARVRRSRESWASPADGAGSGGWCFQRRPRDGREGEKVRGPHGRRAPALAHLALIPADTGITLDLPVLGSRRGPGLETSSVSVLLSALFLYYLFYFIVCKGTSN